MACVGPRVTQEHRPEEKQHPENNRLGDQLPALGPGKYQSEAEVPQDESEPTDAERNPPMDWLKDRGALRGRVEQGIVKHGHGLDLLRKTPYHSRSIAARSPPPAPPREPPGASRPPGHVGPSPARTALPCWRWRRKYTTR